MQALLRVVVAFAALLPAAALAQAITFGGLKGDPKAPVEVTSDSLSVNQETGQATFLGHVVVVQGAMRLSADTLRVEYSNTDKTRIERLYAEGKVVLVNAKEAAEAEKAVYAIDLGQVVMTGNVLLTQGDSTISGESLTVDLRDGTGRIEGRVKTILTPGGD